MIAWAHNEAGQHPDTKRHDATVVKRSALLIDIPKHSYSTNRHFSWRITPWGWHIQKDLQVYGLSYKYGPI